MKLSTQWIRNIRASSASRIFFMKKKNLYVGISLNNGSFRRGRTQEFNSILEDAVTSFRLSLNFCRVKFAFFPRFSQFQRLNGEDLFDSHSLSLSIGEWKIPNISNFRATNNTAKRAKMTEILFFLRVTFLKRKDTQKHTCLRSETSVWRKTFRAVLHNRSTVLIDALSG